MWFGLLIRQAFYTFTSVAFYIHNERAGKNTMYTGTERNGQGILYDCVVVFRLPDI